MPQSLAVKSATEAGEDCRQNIARDSRLLPSVANAVDTGVSASQQFAGDREIPTTLPTKAQSRPVFPEHCEAGCDMAEDVCRRLIAAGIQRLVINVRVCRCHILGVVEPASLLSRQQSAASRVVLTNGHTGHVPRAPRFFLFEGPPTRSGEINYLKLIILLLLQRSTVRKTQ